MDATGEVPVRPISAGSVQVMDGTLSTMSDNSVRPAPAGVAASTAAASAGPATVSDRSHAPSERKPSQDIIVYWQRWPMLLMFGLSSFMNAALWICFAPIQKEASAFFSVGKLPINLLSIVFMALYLPGTLVSSYILDRWGVRVGIIYGVALNFLCALVRYFGSLLDEDEWFHHSRYAVVFFGQFLGAMAQPVFTNAPAKIAGCWFPVEDRDVATTVATMLNPLGNAAGSVIPSIIVTDADDLPTLMWVMAVATGVSSLIVGVFFVEKPPTPPSRSAQKRDFHRNESIRRIHAMRTPTLSSPGSVGSLSPTSPSPHETLTSSQKLWLEGSELLRDTNFIYLLIGFSVGLGLFNAMLTLISQIVQPCGYDSGNAGMFGGVLIGAGLLGAAVAGPLLEHTKAYVPMLKGGIIWCLMGVTFFLAMLKPGNLTVVAVSFGVMGFAMTPMLPLVLENCAECTYPIGEETGAALLLIGGQLLGIVFIFALHALIPDKCDTRFMPSSLLIFFSVILAAAVLIPFKKRYRRAAAEAGRHSFDDQAESMNAPLLDAPVGGV